MPIERSQLESLRIHREEESPAGARRWWPLVVAVAVVAGAAGWWLTRPPVSAVRTAPAVEVKTVGGGRAVLNASGYVTARRKATVSSKVTGKVVEVNVEEGMQIAADQVLARLDDVTVRRQLALAEAQLTSARQGLREIEVRLDEARKNLRRAEDLVAKQVSSELDLDSAKANVDALLARLEVGRGDVTVAERRLSLARQDLDDTVIRAPFAGVATTKDAQPGEMISPVSAGGGFTRTGICTLVDMASLEIEVDVSEAYLQRVTPNQPVTAVLDAYPDWQIPARVIITIPTADRQKATVKVRIGFVHEPGAALDPRILPDMGVKVTFLGNEEPAAANKPVLRVPRPAVRTSDEQQVVFVLVGDHVERRAVRVGTIEGENAELLSGVVAGERVVTEGPETLADGARARERQ
jgi:RND family efflux transporter MFP subunit